MTCGHDDVQIRVFCHHAGDEAFVPQVGDIEIGGVKHRCHVALAAGRLGQRVGQIHAQEQIVRRDDRRVILACRHAIYRLVDEHDLGAGCGDFLIGAGCGLAVQRDRHQKAGFQHRNRLDIGDLLGVIPVGVGFGHNFDTHSRKGFLQANQLLAGPVIAHPPHRDGDGKLAGLDLGKLFFGQHQIGCGKARLAALPVRHNHACQIINLGQFHRLF